MKNFACLYEPGLSGTWLSWFVNQHANFPNYECGDVDINGIVTDLYCDGATWCFRKDEDEDRCTDPPYTYDEYVKYVSNYDSRNRSAIKNCIKVLPDHDLSLLSVDSDLFRAVLYPMDSVIIPVLSPGSPLIESYVARLRFMWGNDRFDMYRLMIGEIYERMCDATYERKYQMPVHYVHLDKLLNGDEQEYNLLLSAIDESPIDNWQQVVADYRVNFIEKDYKNA